LYATAQQLLTDLRQSHWVLIQRSQHVIPLPFLVVLLFWLTMLHISFGLFAPRNATVIAVLLISALSVSGAVFIVLDMTHPLQGVITVSSAPMRKALELLGQ
jgi:membrane-bound ClpP family serine protease